MSYKSFGSVYTYSKTPAGFESLNTGRTRYPRKGLANKIRLGNKYHAKSRKAAYQSEFFSTGGSLTTTIPRPEHLVHALYVRPSSIELRFADGLAGTWSFRELDLDMANMKLSTIRASCSGNSIEVKSKSGEAVQLDSSWLRSLINPEYAAEIERTLDSLLACKPTSM